MDRSAFMAICHDFAMTFRIAGFPKTADALRSLEVDASRRTFWNRQRATSALLEAHEILQGELAAALEH